MYGDDYMLDGGLEALVGAATWMADATDAATDATAATAAAPDAHAEPVAEGGAGTS